MAGDLSSSAAHTVYAGGYGVAAGGANREDLSDIVYNIDPWDTPLFVMAKKGVARHTTHEWLEYALRASGIGGAKEGGAFSGDARPTPIRQTTLCQIFRADTEISDTQIAVDSVGALGQYRGTVVDGLREIRRNFEIKCFSAAGAAAPATGGTGTARTMNTLQGEIQKHAYHADDSGTLRGAGSTASGHELIEDTFVSLVEQVYLDGGNPMHVFVSPVGKTWIAKWGSSNTFGNSRVIAAQDKMLNANINFYESPVGGVLNVVTDRWVPTGSNGTADKGVATGDGKGGLFLLDMQRISVDFLRTARHVPIPKGGDSTRGIVLMEATLKVINAGQTTATAPTARASYLGGHGRLFGVSNIAQ